VRAAWVLLVLAGCKPPAEATLDEYLRLVGKKDFAPAYALMSADYRRDHDRAAFDREAQAAPTQRRAAAKVSYRAEVSLAGFPSVPLVWEDSAWRLARDPLDTFPQDSPEAALQSFTRAIEAERWQIVLRFIPARYRSNITADILRSRWAGAVREDLLHQLAAVPRPFKPDTIELSNGGDDARIRFGDRKQLHLVRDRDDNQWKVESID